jgi:HK97 gp10 family phage protein
MAAFNVETKLLLDIDGAMARLTAAAGEKTLRAAGFAGAEVFRDEVIMAAPKDTGFLKSQIGVVRATEKSDGENVQTYLVKVLTFATKYANTKANVRAGRVTQSGISLKKYQQTDAFYWRFFEFGSSKMAARPFIRPSFDSKKDEALRAMRTKLAEKISEALSGKL